MFSVLGLRKKKFRQLPQTTISQSTGANNDSFGYSVALSSDGTTAIVGAYGADPGGITNVGDAVIFTRSGTTWTQQQIINMSGGSANDLFGSAVALSGDGNTALIAALQDDVGSNADAGSVQVFTRSAGTWTLQQVLNASTQQASAQFGYSVALSYDGNTALIGAALENIGANADQGAAYVFTRSGTTWTQQQKLTQSNGATNDLFGCAVALSGDGNTALIGAYADDIGANVDQGSATVFTRSGGVWTQQQTLVQSNGEGFDWFGFSVSLSGDGNTALIGALQDTINTINSQGSATIFTRSGATWTQQQTITQSTGAAYDQFGCSVSLSGDGNTALVGAPTANVGGFGDVGLATVFTRANNVWTEQKILSQTSGTASDYFGISVALSYDGKVAIGGAQYGVVGSNISQGNATIFYRR